MALSLLRRSAKGQSRSPSNLDDGARVSSPPEDISASLDDFPLSWHILLEVLPDGIAFVDGTGVIRYANDQLASITGYTRRELVSQTLDFLVPSLKETEQTTFLNDNPRYPIKRKTIIDVDLTLVCSDLSELAVHLDRSPFVFAGDTWQVVTIRDIYAQKAAELAHAEAELRFHMAFDGNAAPMTVTNLDDHITAVNDAFCLMVGFSREELLGQDSRIFTYPEDVGITEESHRRVIFGEVEQARYIKRYLRKDKRVIFVEVSRAPARDENGRLLYFVFSERDITEERALTAQLSHQALHDPLTGLANRALFMDRLSQAHARVSRQGGRCAVLVMDLDNFKGVNDTHGHLVGDQLLVAIAHRLTRSSRSSDSLCRSGDDEFLYLAEGLATPEDAELVAKRLLRVLTEPFTFADVTIEQHASVGVVIWDATCTDQAEVIQNADVALFEAKRTGKGRYVTFQAGMDKQAVNRFELVQELRQAFNAGEISMNYQPIVDLTTTAVVGFEALMRWHHPERGLVPPVVFIPLAEQSDLILELGAFALREAIDAASKWERKGLEASWPYITVNLSAKQFQDPNLVSIIEGALYQSGLGPERLVIEITEGVALLDVAETLDVVERLNRLGVGFALDDFGTGYSSLSYLALMRPRIIKIDQTFVSPANESVRNDTLLEAIVSMGQKLNMSVLAEGIETRRQFVRLQCFGCELGQGFLFSPAVASAEAAAMVGRVLGS
ncbi:MAG: EAL domain-containing protein [Acidimicrobiales bacterium]|jgi:diguanylate cyclase (GGDEF)-like protein/PAS domain S-box-containing protein